MPLDKTHSTTINPSQRQLLCQYYAWTLRSDGISPCLAEDVLHARESGLKDFDFYWLGRVPCRTVKLVGTIVGIFDYEIRRVYTIDDGSALIECVHRPLPPLKKGTTRTNCMTQSVPLPPPISPIGHPVTVIGRINKRGKKPKQIIVDQITRCSSINDEASHWKLALDLRQDYYFTNTPFVIPPLTDVVQEVQEILVCEDKSSKPLAPESPSTSSAPSTKPLSSAALSPGKILTSTLPRSPPKLRHPSRLRTRDLTTNTFRIYVKYYMDNHPLWADNNILECEVSNTLSKSRMVSDSLTPKTLSNRASDCAPIHKMNSETTTTHPELGGYGFTLSYLRRVPELQDMARKVIDADDKRKRREERKVKEDATSKGSQPIRKTQKDSPKKSSRREKTKRLFRHAILKLCDEGSIVIWDGSKRVWQPDGNRDNSGLWKMDFTISSTWIGSTQSVSCGQVMEDDELSDPSPEEESYVSLTPAYLGKYVEKAIKDIMVTSLASSEYKPMSGPKGPNKNEILLWLRGDGRWRRVCDWAVDEALDWLKKEERVWDVGDGRWELTI